MEKQKKAFNTTYTPEDEFSDRVKRFLVEDLSNRGIVVNREVEIKRKPEGARTDIYVNAVTKNKSGELDTLSLIIETKGDWHKDVLSAMETQLANKYLKENKSKYGIYLVGNFYCEHWDDSDYKKKDAERSKIIDNDERLLEQARDLSEQGYCITSYVLDAKFRS